MSLLSSKKFVHNNFNGLAISALFTAHLSCRLYVRAFPYGRRVPHLRRIRTLALSASAVHLVPANIPYPGCMILVREPCIVPHEVICLYVGTRALSPNSNLLSSSGYAARIEFLLLLHQGPCNDKHLCRKLHAHLRADPLLPLPAFELVGEVGHELSVPC